jgi:hypothetical protein
MPSSENQNEKSSQNAWNAGWDEQWDQDSVEEPAIDPNFAIDEKILSAKTNSIFEKEFENALEKVLESADNSGLEFSDAINWGTIEDIKPTNLGSRLKSFFNAPFSSVLDTKKPKPLEISLEHPLGSKIEKNEDNREDKKFDLKSRPRIKLQAPKIHSTISDSNSSSSKKIVFEQSDLSFQNLNSISRKELNDVNSLLEGSLGKLDKVKFDQEVVQEKNINFAAQEKLQIKKRPTATEIAKEKEREKALSISAEQTIASEIRPDETLVAGLNDIRFDLKSAQDGSKLFAQNEINEALGRIPQEKARILKEKISRGEVNAVEALESKKLGEAVFGKDDSPELAAENLSTTDDLLDSLLDEIDGDLNANSFDKKDLTESEIESLGKDEIITEKNIIDDEANAALAFMDSAAQEAESLFEDFFKKGTEKEKVQVEIKLTYKDLIKAKIKDLKKIYQLLARFSKDPKYILTYFKITLNDVYIAVGLIFCFLIYTGIIRIQFITEKFPMNLF